MKATYLILCLFTALLCGAQEQKPEYIYNHLKIQVDQLIFEKTFKLDSTPKAEVERLVFSLLSSKANVSNVMIVDDKIIAVISNASINTSKSEGELSQFMNAEFSADITVSAKDGKYKVVVSSIYFGTKQRRLENSETTGTIAFIDAVSNQFLINKKIVRSGKCLEDWLSQMFEVKNESFSQINVSEEMPD